MQRSYSFIAVVLAGLVSGCGSDAATTAEPKVETLTEAEQAEFQAQLDEAQQQEQGQQRPELTGGKGSRSRPKSQMEMESQ